MSTKRVPHVIELASGPKINDKFPNLRGSTQYSDVFDLYDYIGDNWTCLFTHPGDFTPVCTTELGQAANMSDKFEERGVKLVGFSCNDSESHRVWIEDILDVTGGHVRFPLFCDPKRRHAVNLGILDRRNKDQHGLPLLLRSVYIIKPDKTVALTMTYPASTGRNFDEIFRCIDSVQLTERNRVYTPADWKRGEDVVVSPDLTDLEAEDLFGRDAVRVTELPSEQGKNKLSRHYLRYTSDPSLPSTKAKEEHDEDKPIQC